MAVLRQLPLFILLLAGGVSVLPVAAIAAADHPAQESRNADHASVTEPSGDHNAHDGAHAAPADPGAPAVHPPAEEAHNLPPRAHAAPRLTQRKKEELPEPEFALTIQRADLDGRTPRGVVVAQLETHFPTLSEDYLGEALLWWETPRGRRTRFILRPLESGLWASRLESDATRGVHYLMLVLFMRSDTGATRVYEQRYTLNMPEMILALESTVELTERPEPIIVSDYTDLEALTADPGGPRLSISRVAIWAVALNVVVLGLGGVAVGARKHLQRDAAGAVTPDQVRQTLAEAGLLGDEPAETKPVVEQQEEKKPEEEAVMAPLEETQIINDPVNEEYQDDIETSELMNSIINDEETPAEDLDPDKQEELDRLIENLKVDENDPDDATETPAPDEGPADNPEADPTPAAQRDDEPLDPGGDERVASGNDTINSLVDALQDEDAPSVGTAKQQQPDAADAEAADEEPAGDLTHEFEALLAGADSAADDAPDRPADPADAEDGATAAASAGADEAPDAPDSVREGLSFESLAPAPAAADPEREVIDPEPPAAPELAGNDDIAALLAEINGPTQQVRRGPDAARDESAAAGIQTELEPQSEADPEPEPEAEPAAEPEPAASDRDALDPDAADLFDIIRGAAPRGAAQPSSAAAAQSGNSARHAGPPAPPAGATRPIATPGQATRTELEEAEEDVSLNFNDLSF